VLVGEWWDHDQGVRVGMEKEVDDGWVVAASVSAEQKFMSLRAKRALGEGSGCFEGVDTIPMSV